MAGDIEFNESVGRNEFVGRERRIDFVEMLHITICLNFNFVETLLSCVFLKIYNS